MMKVAATLPVVATVFVGFLLSGFEKLEDVGRAVQDVKIQCGRFKMTLGAAFAVFSLIQLLVAFLYSSDKQKLTEHQLTEMTDFQWQAKWRADRNLIIWSLNAYLWCLLVVLSARLKQLRRRLKDGSKIRKNDAKDDNTSK
eukprot:GHVH01015748.1.p1 GENE.GHVH01015748.1~~GHVH01015748.1.p1  ORF type:complete len:141 (+),score=19.24 GHVH01015748.1:179-601(+)